ncbi:gamma-glutamylcyclotransferase [Trichothermofontia sichuanensis B231]|uniref:gamma-glutamylcyclotransferase family protein n=1 Tax=Trichothermofontia sichuanensis TaxID=3045816 RepID=UPI002247D69B|nr:gamma-glutamylcyclotransferase family protein [Trichothermofontia sichuanensis]UZQ55171.1 gamma-glutamylcyclotransferase [Trichothermofontia sichuanensis B231]
MLVSLPNSRLRIFVYGTLKPGEVNYDYLQGQTFSICDAFTRGYLYYLPTLGYPALIPGKGTVYGTLLHFIGIDILAHLDALEGYSPDRPAVDNEYQRQQLEVYGLDGKSLGRAWGYVMVPEQVERLGGIFLPAGWWSGRGTKIDSLSSR